jgi:thiosulfate dehydrogenase [quinone] large subunit
LPYAGTWSYIVAFGEVLVGIGLILGALTGIAAFFGIFMNFNYLLAGTVSTNPILLALLCFSYSPGKLQAGGGWIDRYCLSGRK